MDLTFVSYCLTKERLKIAAQKKKEEMQNSKWKTKPQQTSPRQSNMQQRSTLERSKQQSYAQHTQMPLSFAQQQQQQQRPQQLKIRHKDASLPSSIFRTLTICAQARYGVFRKKKRKRTHTRVTRAYALKGEKERQAS